MKRTVQQKKHSTTINMIFSSMYIFCDSVMFNQNMLYVIVLCGKCQTDRWLNCIRDFNFHEIGEMVGQLKSVNL